MAQALYAMTNPYRDIFEQFVDEASFLWLLRSIAVKQPHYLPEDIAELEQRIENNLDGLLVSSDEVWEICESAMELEEPGEIFTAAIVALQSLDAKKIQQVLTLGLSKPETFKALVSALAWQPSAHIDLWLKKFLKSKDLDHKHLAIAVMSVRRQDPGSYLASLLKRDDCKSHDGLYGRCLRLIGELKRADLAVALKEAVSDERDVVRFWSAWSLILLGDHSSLDLLEECVKSDSDFREDAVAIFFRSVPIDRAKRVISDLVKAGEHERAAIRAAAVLGDPHAIPWIISKMDSAELARIAGEAFTQVTGIHLDENQLSIDIPEIPGLPNDDPSDDRVELDDDENLPWPDAEKIKAIWQRYGSQFRPGTRYLLGKELTAEELRACVASGLQRHRHEAALELAIHESLTPLKNIFSRVI